MAKMSMGATLQNPGAIIVVSAVNRYRRTIGNGPLVIIPLSVLLPVSWFLYNDIRRASSKFSCHDQDHKKSESKISELLGSGTVVNTWLLQMEWSFLHWGVVQNHSRCHYRFGYSFCVPCYLDQFLLIEQSPCASSCGLDIVSCSNLWDSQQIFWESVSVYAESTFAWNLFLAFSVVLIKQMTVIIIIMIDCVSKSTL